MDFHVRFEGVGGGGSWQLKKVWKGIQTSDILLWSIPTLGHQMETIAHFTFQFLRAKFRAFNLRGTKTLLSLPCFDFVVYFYLWLYRGSYQVPSINMWAHICDFFSEDLENFRKKGKALQTTQKKRTLRCLLLETSINYYLIQSQKYFQWIKIWLSKKYNINFLCPCFILYGLSAVQKASPTLTVSFSRNLLTGHAII